MMKLFVRSAWLALSAGLLAGCAWVPQKLAIAPELHVPASNIGNGATVVVRVLDARPTQLIGHRGLDSKGAQINADPNLSPIFQQKIIEGLTQQGFKAVSASDEPARVLKVEIRTLQYSTDMDFWKEIVRAAASIRAYSRVDAVIFDQVYVAERKQTTAEALGAKANEQLINGVIADVLEKLLRDPRLIRLLAD